MTGRAYSVYGSGNLQTHRPMLVAARRARDGFRALAIVWIGSSTRSLRLKSCVMMAAVVASLVGSAVDSLVFCPTNMREFRERRDARPACNRRIMAYYSVRAAPLFTVRASGRINVGILL